jgi:serine/threonine-protein kinase RsbW
MGELDSVTVPGLRDAVDEAVTAGCTTIVIDLSDVTYLDSSALGFIVWADRRLQPLSGRLALAGASRDVSRILELSGLIGLAPSVVATGTVAEALRSVEPHSNSRDPQWVEVFTFPADVGRMAEVRGRIANLVSSLDLSESAVFDIKVASGEALANAIRHGSPHGPEDEIAVEVRAFDDHVEVVVSDAGCGFDGQAPMKQDVYASSGRGVLFMRALMDGVEFSACDRGGTSVKLAKRIARPVEAGV